MSIAVIPTVGNDIVDDAAERELWIVGRLFEHPPYFHAGKGGDTRLAEALRMCLDDKITPQSDGSYQVQGSGGRVYRVAEGCSCPASQHAKSRWCKHAVGVAVYVEWQRRLRPVAPVALGTLRAGTLPLPPVTVDERLAQPSTLAERQRNYTQASLPPTADDEDPQYVTPTMPQEARAACNEEDAEARDLEPRTALGMLHDNTALQTHHTPQEDRMADDGYIPEPDDQDAPVAVVEAPAPVPATRPLPGPVLLPSLDARTLEQSMQAYAAQRAVVTRYIKEQMTEGVDYYTLTIKGRVSKATLSKAGSEKFLSLFQLHAAFEQDQATWQMLGAKDGVLCYTCTLMTRSGEVIGEGRGARSITQDGGDINKAIKMATKSAQVDAVLRTGALSDVFTQDLEHEEPTRARENAQEQRARIWAIVQKRAPEAKSREAVEAWIKEKTGLLLHPDQYETILHNLGV